MTKYKLFARRAGAAATLVLAIASPSVAQSGPSPSIAVVTDTAAARDGQHDFDFLIGDWEMHMRRLVKPLTGSTTWVALEGRTSCRKVWGGKANMDEVEAHSADGKMHTQGMTLALYNPDSRKWSLWWANAATGEMGLPATVGQFTNGRGEFFDQEEYNGRPIVVRFLWSNITENSVHFEQAFSTDSGKTWETNWVTDRTRVER